VLTALTIRDVVLIDALTVEFGRGLCVLTGETGAGKSIVLDSLGLALGARSDAGLVRPGAGAATVTAAFQVPGDHPALLLLAEQAVDDGGEILLRRTVRADGGSRAFVNDQAVSASLLRALGDRLIEIHGQQDDRGLLNSAGHRDLLDAFAGLDALRQKVASAHKAWRAAEQAVRDAQEAIATADRDRDWLSHAVDELTQLAPKPGEDVQLADRRSTMQRGAKIGEDLGQVDSLMSGADGGAGQLRQAARRLERLAAQEPLLVPVLETLDRAVAEALEAEAQLDAAKHALAFDPDELEATETRLFELRAAARKFRCRVDELPTVTADLAQRLELLHSGTAALAGLDAALKQARSVYTEAAAQLSAARQDSASRLDGAVAGELAPLKLEAARFRTQLAILDEADWGVAGKDRVAFEISTNPGAPFGPLTKIASGGELSRFVLALKVALAEGQGATTMIFDEIDRGVGGAVAAAVGERLARLADKAQVIVITHSPQVAARANHHWRISKSLVGGLARTDVVLLDDQARREEIARMLSGDQVTDEARAQAQRLLAVA
jgi:DNA repair protein RecN (Recombination protein N)